MVVGAGPNRPGGKMVTRPLHFIWIIDVSGSMRAKGKIQALNNTIRECIPHMRRAAADNPNAQVLVRALTFSTGADWHIPEPTPIERFEWDRDVQARGLTDMGLALSLTAEQLKAPMMPARALPPVLVLISDGQPTDDYLDGLSQLMDQPWGQKAVRVAIAIGGETDTDVLQKFIGRPGVAPLQANNPEVLARHIRWVSTVVLDDVSSTGSDSGHQDQPKVDIPVPLVPLPTSNGMADDVWG